MMDRKIQTTKRKKVFRYLIKGAFCVYFPQMKRGTAGEGGVLPEMVVV